MTGFLVAILLNPFFLSGPVAVRELDRRYGGPSLFLFRIGYFLSIKTDFTVCSSRGYSGQPQLLMVPSTTRQMPCVSAVVLMSSKPFRARISST